jgi:hypothetical protein
MWIFDAEIRMEFIGQNIHLGHRAEIILAQEILLCLEKKGSSRGPLSLKKFLDEILTQRRGLGKNFRSGIWAFGSTAQAAPLEQDRSKKGARHKREKA